jgi:glycine/D-amino acid oxidase-like deaminating enzyme
MKKKTVIIGADINSLMCAYHLLKQNKLDIQIYDQNQIPNIDD